MPTLLAVLRVSGSEGQEIPFMKGTKGRGLTDYDRGQELP
jgi:hypothetical protein